MENNRGAIIAKLIEDNGMRLQEVAEQLGIGRTTIWRWMNDPKLSLKKMNRVADLFGVNNYSFSKLAYPDGEKKIVEEETIEIKDKYVLILEQNNRLIKENSELKEKLFEKERDKLD